MMDCRATACLSMPVFLEMPMHFDERCDAPVLDAVVF
jgi:hypothetical protein